MGGMNETEPSRMLEMGVGVVEFGRRPGTRKLSPEDAAHFDRSCPAIGRMHWWPVWWCGPKLRIRWRRPDGRACEVIAPPRIAISLYVKREDWQRD